VNAGEERPWLDAGLPVERRVDLLLQAMTLEEKVGQTHQLANVDADRHARLLENGAVGSTLLASGVQAGNVRDTGVAAGLVNAVQRLAVERSRLGVPLLVALDVLHGYRTVFPIPLGMAATFDPDVVRRAARVAAVEASADGIRWTFAPMVDIARDPRWGRVAEGFGEDPWLASRLGAAAVEGFQGADLAAEGALAACAKHFVGYGLAEGGRDYDSVDVGATTLRNVHLRPFRACVDAGAATVMSAFNDLDGVPMTMNGRWLREELKESWRYDGLVVSDWGAVAELCAHGVAADLPEAAALAFAAGVDVDMVSEAYHRHLAELVGRGVVPLERLDDAVRRVLRVKIRLGLFERPYVDTSRAGGVTLTEEHRAAARETAAASLVLLRNDGVLPLRPGSRVCLVGPFVDAGAEMLGTWTLDGRGEESVRVSDAFRERIPSDRLEVDDARFPDAMLVRARRSDVVVALVGEHPLRSGEANSVTSLELPPGQDEWLRRLHDLGRPLVVVVLSGRPLALSWAAEHAGALVLAWHPGTEGGHAVADVLLGDVAPSGRLPVSLPRTTGQVPLHSGRKPTGRPLDPRPEAPEGRYRDALDLPLYPFGHGLTYGEVNYADLVVPATVTLGEPVEVAVTVQLTGAVEVVETVQLYLRDPVAAVTRPVRELVATARVRLTPGEARRVSLAVEQSSLGYHDATGAWCVDPGRFEIMVGRDAAHGLTATFDLVPAVTTPVAGLDP
jgi:beta-glucosidase